LSSAGWQLLRINGSHHIYGKPGVQVRLSVPVHGNKTLKIGLLRNLAKLGRDQARTSSAEHILARESEIACVEVPAEIATGIRHIRFRRIVLISHGVIMIGAGIIFSGRGFVRG
jgi:predicted RNA binding protein YcfA (HicA-like mRNA interferase family)